MISIISTPSTSPRGGAMLFKRGLYFNVSVFQSFLPFLRA